MGDSSSLDEVSAACLQACRQSSFLLHEPDKLTFYSERSFIFQHKMKCITPETGLSTDIEVD